MTLNLLVSVRDLAEAEMVMEEKVAWIDLKDPLYGSLGRPSRETLATVGAFLHGHPQRSVALGELADLPHEYAHFAAGFFPYMKVGLSGQLASTIPWQKKLNGLAESLTGIETSIVPVAYADHSRCQAPSIKEVFSFACEQHSKYFLIDTFFKDGKTLLDWVEPCELFELNKQATAAGFGLVLAGSLRLSDFPKVMQCAPAAIAVRGAACSGSRTGCISRERIVDLKNALSLEDSQCFDTPGKVAT